MKKILFICLGSQFSPDMYYKDNYMIKAAVEYGHEVLVITTNMMYIDGVETDVGEGTQCINGYTLIRIKNKPLLFKVLTDKIRYTPGLIGIIKSYKPDLIFYNCPQIYNINELGRIKKEIPWVKVIWDFSTWYGNSGKNWFSLNILHKMIYKSWLIRNQRYVDKIYYTADDPHTFIREVYGLDEKKMELHDLPGEAISVEEKRLFREKVRKEFNLDSDDVLFVHTGKLDNKKKTIELLHGFVGCDNKKFKLLIIGSLDDSIKKEALEILSKDKRIFYLGFKKGKELIDYIRGCDVYLQPGSTSQTLNDAVCAGCAIVYRDRNYDNELIGDNGWRISDDLDLKNLFKQLTLDDMLVNKIENYSKVMMNRGKERLDYRRLFKRMID